jgi:hypothetical protein
MRFNKIIFLVMFFMASTFFASYTEAKEKDQILAKKTLTRWIDPVITEGKLVKDLADQPLSQLRLYAYRNGEFAPIRFQIDEMTEGGDWILPEGPRPNSSLSNGKLDVWDKIVFMADDTGDRISKDAWPKAYAKGAEIEVIDPLTGGKGWCYIIAFTANPPDKAALPDYVQYDYASEIVRTEYFGCEYVITKKGLHTTFYKRLWGEKKIGASGESFVDRLKIRIKTKALFGSVAVQLNEDQMKSDVLAYKRGPVRVIRRGEQYVLLPAGLKAARAVADVVLYRNISTVPMVLNIPFKLDTVLTAASVKLGTDNSDKACGGKVYNSNNLKGFAVDGRMDDGEDKFNPKLDKWRLVTGNFGAFMSRTIFTPEVLQKVDIVMGLIDDATYKDPPESNPGCFGYVWQDWNISRLERGKYHLFVEVYVMPDYKVGDEVPYLNYQDQPIKVRSGNIEGKNQALLVPKLGSKYR